jgi:hypothetical protein
VIRCLLALLGCAAVAWPAELKRETVQAFERYVRGVEARSDARLRSDKFLWAEEAPGRLERVRGGEIAIEPLAGKGDLPLPDGLVHDWVGAVFVPGVPLSHALIVVQDYNSHHKTHRPEVLDSKTLSRNGNDFRIYLRVMKKKVITVVLNTEHEVHYHQLDATRWHSRSYSTRIAEVSDPGGGDEREQPVDRGHGFLWRLYSYWRFQERDGGVYIECEAVSLTRDVPTGLGWLIEPIIRKLPRESLENKLRSTRSAIANRPRAATSVAAP